MYTNTHAAALLCAFTYDQQMAIIQLCRTESDAIRVIMEARAKAPSLVPIFSLIDLGSAVEPVDISNWLTGLSIVFTTTLRRPWTVADLADMLDRGGAVPSDYAARIANDIITPDTDMAGLAYRLTNSIAALPFVPDSVVELAQPWIQAANFLTSFMSSRDTGRDNNVTVLRIGEATNKLSKEMLFTFAEANFERLLLPPDSGGVLQSAHNIWSWLTGQTDNLMPPGGINPQLPPGGSTPLLSEGGDLTDHGADAAFRYMQEVSDELGDLFDSGDISSLTETGFIPPGLATAVGKVGLGAARSLVGKLRRGRASRRAKGAHVTPRAMDQARSGLSEFRASMLRAGLNPDDQRDVNAAMALVAYSGGDGQSRRSRAAGRAADVSYGSTAGGADGEAYGDDNDGDDDVEAGDADADLDAELFG